MIESTVGGFDMMDGMSREFVENIVLVLLSLFLVGIMVVAGCMLVVWIPAFARFLFIVWYVLIV